MRTIHKMMGIGIAAALLLTGLTRVHRRSVLVVEDCLHWAGNYEE